MYHNTNKEKGKTLANSRKKADLQETRVMDFMNRVKEASPERVWTEAFETNVVPLTSVRRAISNLTRQGKLVKTDRQVAGMYGKMISVWALV